MYFKFIKSFFTIKCSNCSTCDVKPIKKEEILNKKPIVQKINSFILESNFSLILFLIILFWIFEITFLLWGFIANYLDSLWTYLLNILDIQNMFLLTVWWAIFWLLIYLPNVIILYIFLYYLDDSWILWAFSKKFDRYLAKIWISWKWFLSMFLWFGCTVPAILSTSMIENKKERIIVTMALPFISCSAKLPVFVLIISAFISSKYQSLALFSLYLFWILLAVLTSFLFSKILKHDTCSIKKELVIYKIPSFRNIMYKIYCVIKDFIFKIAIFVIPLSIVLTLAFSYPKWDVKNTYWAKVGEYVYQVFKPLWFNKEMSMSILPGLIWKEIVVSTLASLYYINDSEDSNKLIDKIKNDETITFAGAMAFLVFILVYTSCVGSIITAFRQVGKKWGLIFMFYPIVLAYILSFVVYNILV